MAKTTTERYQLIYGNTARKLQAEPAYEPKRRRRVERPIRPQETPEQKRNRQKATTFDFAFVRLLVVSLVLCAGLSLFYLSQRSSILSQRSMMAQKKTELSALQVENEDLNLEIEQSINMANIERMATKYGMKKPSTKQVLFYNNKNAEYVRQYGTIPKAD